MNAGTAAVLSLLDVIYILKEEQKTALKDFLVDVFALLPFGFGKNSVHSSQLQGGYVLFVSFVPNAYMTYIQRIGKKG